MKLYVKLIRLVGNYIYVFVLICLYDYFSLVKVENIKDDGIIIYDSLGLNVF